MSTYKGNELDYLSDAQLKAHLFEAEAQELALGILTGKNLKREVRENSKMMKAITRQLAEQVLARDTVDE